MSKEFYKKFKKWDCEGWVELSFKYFGLGIIPYNTKGTHNIEINILFFEFYVSFYKSRG